MKLFRNSKTASVDQLKRELIANYVIIITIILSFYSVYLYLYLQTTFLSFYIFGFLSLVLYTWLIILPKYDINKMVHIYMVAVSLFLTYIMLNAWKNNILVSTWFLPIILAADTFFSKKYVYIYTIYVFLLIVIIFLLNQFYQFNEFIFITESSRKISEVLVFFSNVFILMLLMHYNRLIKRKENDEHNNSIENEKIFISNDSINTEKKPEKDLKDEKDLEKYMVLFSNIKRIIEDERHFTNPDLSLSGLSSLINSNSMYISTAIKLNGYDSYSHYLNFCRIQNVKKMLKEEDLNKVNLMYIYTASGFSNQVTFNRTFKKIEGITPSEYIKSIIPTP